MVIKNIIVKGFSLLKPIPLKDKIINYESLEVAVKGIFAEIKKKEPKITRTNTPENDSNKLFSALGALNLKNWLIDNYTALFNTRLAHGGYGGTGQTLFNLIESAKSNLISLINSNKSKLEFLQTDLNDKVSKKGDTMTAPLIFSDKSTGKTGNIGRSGNDFYIINDTTGKAIQVKDNGYLEYNDKKIYSEEYKQVDIKKEGTKIIKFDDGLMIIIGYAVGGGTTIKKYTFPVSFLEKPIVLNSADTYDIIATTYLGMVGAVTNLGFNYIVKGGDNSQRGEGLNFIAYGKYK